MPKVNNLMRIVKAMDIIPVLKLGKPVKTEWFIWKHRANFRIHFNLRIFLEHLLCTRYWLVQLGCRDVFQSFGRYTQRPNLSCFWFLSASPSLLSISRLLLLLLFCPCHFKALLNSLSLTDPLQTFLCFEFLGMTHSKYICNLPRFSLVGLHLHHLSDKKASPRHI